MTANGPYYQSYDYSFIYNPPCQRGDKVRPKNCENSIMDVIDKNNNTKLFSYIIHLAGLEELFNCKQSQITIFVPVDKFLKRDNWENRIKNMDRYVTRSIVNYSTLQYLVDPELLKNNSNSYEIHTKENSETIRVNTIKGKTTLNNCISILDTIQCCNGIVYLVDNILIPKPFYK